MAKPPRGSDLVSVLRGLARVGSAAVDVRSHEVSRAWATSSLRPAVIEGATKLQEAMAAAVQQPQTLQKNASKSVSETLARISMVTEGLKAYRSGSVQPAQEFSEQLSTEDPMYNPTVGELNIEEMLMQEASSGSSLEAFDPSVPEPLGMVQAEASKIVDKAKSTREEVTQRVQEFEPLINLAKGEEKEITHEHLQALDQKVSELQGISHGQNIMVQEEAEQGNIDECVPSTNLHKQAEHNKDMSESAKSGSLQGLNIENMIMQEAMTGQHDQLLSDSQKILYGEVQGAAEAVKKGVDETRDEVSQRMLGFEPLLEIAKSEEQEITEEHLDAISEKLSEIHDVSFGHDLKIFKGIENPKPVEEVIEDIVAQQTSMKEQETKTILEAEEKDLAKSDLKENAKVQTEAAQEPAGRDTEAAVGSMKVVAELEDSISQVAKPVVVDDSYASTATEVKVDVQVNPTAEAAQEERISTSGAPAEGAMASPSYTSQHSTPTTPDGPGGTTMAEGSSVATAAAAVAAGAVVGAGGTSYTVSTAPAPAVVAAAATAAAAATTPSDNPVIKPEETAAPAAAAKPKPKLLGRKPLAKEKPKSTLAENAQARKVPHSRFGRLVSFGGLAAGLGVGTLAEVTRRSLGLNQGKGSGSLLDASPFLTEANARRIVDTLCRVRGAALKLGQMLSIQDSALINPQLQKIFERVRQSADFMPAWQLEEAIRGQLGEDWRSRVATFDEQPFAAASIGQVHLATLHDGRSVAMKIQYPGVAEGIESDINNLVSTLKVANIFPEGLFVDTVIEVAKRELRWECDYVREVECTRRFRELVKPYPEYYVPEVIPELCTPQIFTSELIAGIPVDKCMEIDQESKNYICEQVLRMCLMELFQFGFMQTDPNWSNFFYNAETEQVALLDFGACREYRKEFVDKYINLIHGAAVKDRQKVLKYSQELGFLTGYEAKVMVDAHIDAIMILGEAFQEDRPFNFGDQNTTYRIQTLVPVMLSHRMCAPPEESYSLHRKMSGVFLLCAKLNGTVNCYRLFHDIYKQYTFGGTWEDFRAGRM